MKNKNIKNILFYLAISPYIALLFRCLFYAIHGYNNLVYTTYGFEAIGKCFYDSFRNLMDFACHNFMTLSLIILWVGYQIYYFISVQNDKKEKLMSSNESNKSPSKKVDLSTILFFISILCWLAYFISGICAYFFGSNTGGGLFSRTMEYGWDAMINTYFWLGLSMLIIPILPISLLYIIIYLIIKKKK